MTLDYLGHLRSESARFLDVLRDTDPSLRVPSCPDWDAGDLLWHLSEVQWFWATIVEDRLQSPAGLEAPERPADHGALVGLFAAQSARLHGVLAAADPAERVYMWAPDKTVGYIRRRQAHEALVHRLDAELVTGQVTAFDPDLAADGVLEVLEVMRGGCPPWGTFTPSSDPLLVRMTDTGGEVPLVIGRFTGTDPESGTSYDEDDLSVSAADASSPPALVVSGTADNLNAWLWARRDASSISFEGDPELAEQLRTVLRQPID
jgi:uncharacterized protein (TIGR03083 family)